MKRHKYLLFLIIPVFFGLEVVKTQESEVNLLFTGDVMLGRAVMSKSQALGDPAYPFAKVAPVLKAADITFINLENPIINNCPTTTSGMKFCTSPQMLKGLEASGVDVVTLANNHSKNYGQNGLDETVRILEGSDILASGLGSLVIKEIKGLKFGFLGFDFVSFSPKEDDFNLVKDSDSKVDILIVGVHWGGEYTDKPSSNQKEWARRLVESGADIVVGHHPHWVQESEYIDGKPVYYSLGNFVFDQMWSEKTRSGLAIRLKFDRKGKIIKEEFLPIYMTSLAQPEFVSADSIK